MHYSGCPLCKRTKRTKVGQYGDFFQCRRCQSLYGNGYLGDSYELVKPFFVLEEPPAEATRYFDFTVAGSAGLIQRHGWFDPTTRRLVQVG